MRNLSKVFVIAVGFLAIGVLSSAVGAKTLLAGSFTLTHSTQWKSTVLPAGNYTFSLAHDTTDTNVLKVRGVKTGLDILVFAQSACDSCQTGALKVAVKGDHRVVTSLDLPGFHVDFKNRQAKAEGEERVNKSVPATEQVAVQVNSN